MTPCLLIAFVLMGADDDKKWDGLLGTWKAVAVEVAGQEQIGGDVRDMTLVIAAGKIKVEGEFGDKDKYTELAFKIDSAKKPRTIDITVTAGDAKGEELPGIYQVEGNKLKLCIRLTGKERPGEFASGADGTVAFITLERGK